MTASTAEELYTLFVYLTGLVGLFAVIVCLLCGRRATLRTIDRHAPVVEDALPRADEALALAQRGTATCQKCTFANFAHVEICAMCGDAVGDDATRRKTRRRRRKLRPLGAYAVRADRATRRNEWSRKVDVWGRIFWFRAAVNGDRGLDLPNAYTFRFHTSTSSVLPIGMTTIEDDLSIRYVDTTDKKVDAIVFPLGPDFLDRAMRVLPWTSEPFPARYAEFVERAAALVPPQGRLRFRLKDASSKQAVFSQAAAQLLSLSPADARSQLMIRLDTGTAFAGANESVDWHRDWLATLGEVLADEATGVFMCANRAEQTYTLNPHSQSVLGERHLDYFFATGRLLGNALLHGDLLALHLAPPLLKVLLGQPLSVTDLQDVDPVVYKSLVGLLAMDSESAVSALSLDFSVQETTPEGHVVTMDLIANGRSVAVTNANKHEYVTRLVQRVLVERVGEQLFALCSGFYEVVPRELLLLLNSTDELDYMLCGPDEIDVHEWERESNYIENLHATRAKKIFWKVVRELPEDYKRRLLHFATGCTRVPLGGFSALKTFDGRRAPFSLGCNRSLNDQVVTAHPCFNHLSLPMYLTEQELRAHLMAILDPETYEFSLSS